MNGHPREQPPPVSILEFLERVGIVFTRNLYGKVTELYPRDARWLEPFVRAALPVIELDLERREAMQRAGKAGSSSRFVPGPRLGQVRVTNIFRGMNLVEAFLADSGARWVEVCWSRRQRDARKVAAQKLLALQASQLSEEPSP